MKEKQKKTKDIATELLEDFFREMVRERSLGRVVSGNGLRIVSKETDFNCLILAAYGEKVFVDSLQTHRIAS